jgi:hypothetical protein
MKPVCQSDSRREVVEFDTATRKLPRTDYFFQSRIEEWRGFSSPHDDPDRFRNFRNLSREYYGTAAREHLKEMIAFGFVVAASAWLVIYMVVTVVQLLSKGAPLDH